MQSETTTQRDLAAGLRPRPARAAARAHKNLSHAATQPVPPRGKASWMHRRLHRRSSPGLHTRKAGWIAHHMSATPTSDHLRKALARSVSRELLDAF